MMKEEKTIDPAVQLSQVNQKTQYLGKSNRFNHYSWFKTKSLHQCMNY